MYFTFELYSKNAYMKRKEKKLELVLRIKNKIMKSHKHKKQPKPATAPKLICRHTHTNYSFISYSLITNIYVISGSKVESHT